ncbi:MAG: hypothetical protein UR89_C0008G0016 [Candidatus Roizmanbacteria bacterium GW2011_GWA2_35_8]|uniref:Uncharacterized protein n=1 Tax=Candidatus Roizmanbacteria bacterium GW2011_GWA2_35_8 TaxID=1618479 RepID=A0A0G0CYH0_9BACT|nr:MAG: hypothetical protein UR89_C0008G0016 [Candidatus Roizmanbacteria bacterium GW2011_GWA2_35_8]
MKIITILGYIIFANLFFFRSGGPVAFGLMTLGRFLFLTLIFKSFKSFKKDLLSTSAVFFALLFFSLGLLLRANVFVQSLLNFASIAALHVYGYILCSEIPMVRSLFELILAPVYFVGSYIKTFFRTIKIIFSGDLKEIGLQKLRTGRSQTLQSLIIGFIIGLFIIGILISMFTNADPIFATFIKKIVSEEFLQNLFLRVVLSILTGFILLPLLILKRKSIFNSPLGLLKRINFRHEMTVVMTLVAIVIGLFLFIQWPYVFVKVPFETDLSKFGVATYSEYVRKGFFELLKISIFVYGLIWAGLIVLRENASKGKSFLKYVQVVVLAEFFIFIFSIFRRVWLYQEYHGWSIVRIYGSFVLLWIFGVTIFLGLRHFWQKRWVIGELIFTVAIIFYIGLFNVESFIVENHPPTVNKKVDYVYLSRMSADGYNGWEKAYVHAKEVINKYENKSTQISRDERKEIAYAGIIIRELSRNYKDLLRQYGTTDELKQYLTGILTFQREANYEIKVPSNSSMPYTTTENNYINETLGKIKEGKVEYRNIIDSITVSSSEEKFKFNMGGFYTIQSFYYVSASYNKIPNNKNKDKEEKITYNKESYLDRLYTWNSSKFSAYKNIVKNERHSELLQLQGKYFNLYMRIFSQPPNERDFDMDISLDSPLLD